MKVITDSILLSIIRLFVQLYLIHVDYIGHPCFHFQEILHMSNKYVLLTG